MANSPRKTFWVLLACAAAVAVPLLISPFESTSRAQANSGSDPAIVLTSAEYDAICSLRNELGLDLSSLVALQVSDAQVQTVLESIVQWYRQNAALLQARNEALSAKQRSLREVEQRIRRGPAGEELAAASSQAQADVAAAIGSRQDLLSGLLTAVQPLLSNAQSQQLGVLRANAGQPLPYRLLLMTKEQREAFQTAESAHSVRMAQARTGEELSNERAAWAGSVSTLLSAEQREVLRSYEANAKSVSARLLALEKRILPLPVEFE